MTTKINLLPAHIHFLSLDNGAGYVTDIPLREQDYPELTDVDGNVLQSNAKFSYVLNNRASLIPLHATAAGEGIEFVEVSPDDKRECTDLILKFEKGLEQEDDVPETIFLKKIVRKLNNVEGIHYKFCFLYDGNSWLPNRGLLRMILLRIYRNIDFECVEHSEMLAGAPLGMYFCDICGAMQVPGMMHLDDPV